MEKVLEHVSDNLSVEITPDEKFEFLMTTNEVAKGFGTNPSSLRSQKHEHRDELIEGKHFITSVGISDTGCKSGGYLQNKQILWTKRGIVRLGFFIKSERAKMFRDWAEDLVINKERLIDILSDVAKIEDKDIRLSLIDKLTNIKA